MVVFFVDEVLLNCINLLICCIVVFLQDLIEVMLRIFNSVRFGDFNEFDDGVKNVFGVVCVLIEFVVQVGCKKILELM